MTAGGELVDVHSHFVTDHYRTEAQQAGHALPDGMPAWPEWSADRQLELMDTHGIRTAVLSTSSPGVHFGDDRAAARLARHVNDTAAELERDHPGRFRQFASLPLPDVPAALAEAERALEELGAAGFTVESNIAGTYLGDPRFEPLLTQLNDRGAAVFIHPTSPPCWEAVSPDRPRPMLEFPFDTTRAVADLLLRGTLVRYPGIRFVIPHCGGTLPLLADRIELFRTAFMSTTDQPSTREQLSRLWYDLAGTPFPAQAPALVELVGTDRLLYGSDFCFTPPPAVAGQVASLDAAANPEPGIGWRELTTRNAEELLKP
ncbi:amidohydrolase family protein [Amycolatopsis endophytica]|uniref:6-methylsalicylate decarboxylase n=1 Tax=Amycolatopsis endophytica TaxID=860233 RepID=A0A853BCF2_9PSEU|nr:amidohydrolase family protein [Amycolatopsis endophytica]NYI92347.1 putative TIM-barrel fold metal-dependent hydrolase [Amycolatopsis endophytica]